MTSREFDDIVDRAARELTDAPAPDLRAAVQARLDAEPPRRSSTWAWQWAAVAATLAVATAGWMMATRDPRVVAPSPTATTQLTPTSAAASAAAAAGSSLGANAVAAPAPAAAPVTARAADRRPRAAAPSAAELAWAERAIPALDAPAPLDLGAIQPAPVHVPLLDVKPIATEPVVIAPLGGAAGQAPGR